MKAGLYKYSDHEGNVVEDPIETRHGRLFVARYPVSGLEEHLKKFVMEEVLDKMEGLKE